VLLIWFSQNRIWPGPSLLESFGGDTPLLFCVSMASPTHKNMTRINHMIERRLCTHWFA